MARHANLQVDTCLRVYFCDPTEHRGTNENTNGLLRQYFAKGTNISVHKPTTWRPCDHPQHQTPKDSCLEDTCGDLIKIYEQAILDMLRRPLETAQYASHAYRAALSRPPE